jgi:two-component system, NarL family, nitrate/nitrite response regulator NarL
MNYQEPQIRVVVADDHPVTREGVVRALKSSGKIEVVASVSDGRAALEAIRELRPAVALLDA